MTDNSENKQLTAQVSEDKETVLPEEIKEFITDIVKKEGPLRGFAEDLKHPDGSSFTEEELLEATRAQYIDQAWNLMRKGISKDQIIDYFTKPDDNNDTAS